MNHPPATPVPQTALNHGNLSEPRTDDEILATWPVMSQLRPHIRPEEYLATVRRMMTWEGYRLVAAVDDGEVRAVAGFRVMEMLYSGRILYIDDLITDERFRSSGHGLRILDWLKAEARRQVCRQIHLDSGVQRSGAHRFYFREGFLILGYHFSVDV